MFTKAEYDRGDAIAISWHIDDVLGLMFGNKLQDGYEPTEQDKENAREILANFERHHEGSMEQMWYDLQFHIDNFKEERQ